MVAPTEPSRRRWLRPTSVRARLTLWSVAVMAAVLAALGGALRWSVEVHLMNQVDRDLERRGAMAPGMLQRVAADRGWPPKFDPPPGPPPGDRPGPGQFDPNRRVGPPGPGPNSRPDPGPNAGPGRGRGPGPGPGPGRGPGSREPNWPRFVTMDGKPVFPWDKYKPWDVPTLRRSADGKAILATVTIDDEHVRVYTLPIPINGKVRAAVQLAAPLSDLERDVAGVGRTLLMLIPIALVVAGFSGAFLTGRLLRPVREVNLAAERISAADLSERLPETGSDEFTDLARTLNAMLARLEQSFDRQRRFVADASHELRTPLTAIKAHSSMALAAAGTPEEYRRALTGIDRSATIMTRTIQDLLLLARSDAGQLQMDLREVSILEVADAAAETLRADGVATIDVEVPGALRVAGNAGHLVRLFTNLLENAARHTPADGRITVSASEVAGMVEVKVTDTGSGIAPEHLGRVCERFYRVDESRTRKHGGTGLGLSICMSIAEAHRGSLVVASEPGKGTCVTVRLPVWRAATPA